MTGSISQLFKSKRKELRLSQEDVAKAIGVDQKTISHWENGINEPQLNKLRTFCNNYDVPLSYFTNGTGMDNSNFVLLNFYPDVYASCGPGGLIASQDTETVALPIELLPQGVTKNKVCSVIRVRGNSMSPEILDGDLVLIEHYQGEQIVDNNIYLFMYENEIFVKRLSKNINELIITSDNKDYPQVILRGEDLKNVYIIGKVYGFARKYL